MQLQHHVGLGFLKEPTQLPGQQPAATACYLVQQRADHVLRTYDKATSRSNMSTTGQTFVRRLCHLLLLEEAAMEKAVAGYSLYHARARVAVFNLMRDPSARSYVIQDWPVYNTEPWWKNDQKVWCLGMAFQNSLVLNDFWFSSVWFTSVRHVLVTCYSH